jgi:asparagine synthase (glutamine-hydrolysing)
MCGITGVWHHNSEPGLLKHQVRSAVSAMNHRGPDDSGVWVNTLGVGMGQARLSILDLTPHGHQPMISQDGRYTLVFNGEIYNYQAIRKELMNAGLSFSGTGDSEVVLASLQCWGVDAVQRYIGMFAIALWDEQEQVMTLIRDRVGVKPLYYGWDGKTICFGSELKAIREYNHWSPEIKTEAAGEYFQYGYIASPRTIYNNVYKLQPGHVLRLKKHGEPEVTSYWSLVEKIGSPVTASTEDIEAEIEALMVDSFQYRMVSDVPVGVFLSGGVDSSLVTAILAKHHPENIKTFTIGFKENSHDESVWAKKVAHHLGTTHTEYILGANEALSIARTWGDLFDEPFADPSGIPTLLVSKMASKEVKVVLSADGGDELFSGYNMYLDTLRKWAKLQKVPDWVMHAASAALSLVPDGRVNLPFLSAERQGFVNRRLTRTKHLLADPSASSCYRLGLSQWLPEEVCSILKGYEDPRCSIDRYSGTVIDQMSLLDFHHYLPENIMTKVDRMTMATSIEGREPLLDHRLIEYAFRLPVNMRRGELGAKHILKKILYKHVPRDLVDRPKMGFGVPIGSWLRNDLKPLALEYLDSHRIRDHGLFDADTIEQIVGDFYRGNHHVASKVWSLLAFEMWREKCLK